MIFHQLFYFVYCVRRMKTLLCSGLVCIYSPSSPQSSSTSSSSVSVDFDFPKFFSFFRFAAARLRAKIRMERKHFKLFYLCVEHEIVLMRLLRSNGNATEKPKHFGTEIVSFCAGSSCLRKSLLSSLQKKFSYTCMSI